MKAIAAVMIFTPVASLLQTSGLEARKRSTMSCERISFARWWSSVALLMLFPAFAAGQLSRSTCIEAAKEVAASLEFRWPQGPVDVRKEDVTGDGGTLWTVTCGEQVYVIDDRLAIVIGASDLGREQRAITRESDARHFQKVEDAWTYGAALLDRLEIADHKPLRIKTNPNDIVRHGSNAGKLSMSFCQESHGFPSKGSGNSVEFVLDAVSGDVITFRRSAGWTYDPPKVNLSQAEAVSAAAAIANEPVDSAKAALMYFATNDEFGSSRGGELRRDKRCHLCYVVSFAGGLTVLVDSESGKCLGGARFKSGGERSDGVASGFIKRALGQRPARVYGPEDPRSVAQRQIKFYGAAGVSLIVFAFLLHRNLPVAGWFAVVCVGGK